MHLKTTVAIVEDKKLFRQGLVRLLEELDRFEIVNESSNGLEIIEWLRTNTADIIVMDMQMPEMDGWEATEIITKKYPTCKIIGLSSYDNEAFIDRLVSRGGRGYLLKDYDIIQIAEAIDSVIETGYYFNDRVSIEKIKKLVDSKAIQPIIKTTNLTDREIQIVQLICQQKTNHEIAEELYVTVKTVEGHRERIKTKTKTKNAVGIALYAIKHNLIKIE